MERSVFDGGLFRRPTPDLNRNLLVGARRSTIELLLVTPGRLRSAKWEWRPATEKQAAKSGHHASGEKWFSVSETVVLP